MPAQLMNIVNQITPGNYLAGTSALEYAYLEGFEFSTNNEQFADIVPANATYNGGRTYRIVRNMSATAVTGGQLVIPSQVAGFTKQRTTGPQTTAGDFSYAVDPDLVTCPQYGLYLIVVEGVTQINNATSQADNEGDVVVSTTTSGEGASIASSAVTARQASNAIGRCVGAIGTTTALKMDVDIIRK